MSVIRSDAPIRPAVVAVLLLTAGCSGPALPGGGPPTVTPAPVPSPTAASTPGPTLAPGVGPADVRDAGALAGAHDTVLSNTSYTVDIVETQRWDNGSLRRRYHLTSRVASNHRQFNTTVRIDGQRLGYLFFPNATRVEIFVREAEVSVAATAAGGTRYRQFTSARGGTGTYGDLYVLLASLDVVLVAQVDRGGRPLYRLSASQLAVPAPVGAAIGAVPAGKPQDLTFRALVDDRGFVVEYWLSYAVEFDGVDLRVTRSVRFHHLGATTVDRPAWYDLAAGNSTTTPRGRLTPAPAPG